MKTVFADVKLRGLGEIGVSTIGSVAHDEWYNVSINYKDREGLSARYLHTKELQGARYSTHLKVRFKQIASGKKTTTLHSLSPCTDVNCFVAGWKIDYLQRAT